MDQKGPEEFRYGFGVFSADQSGPSRTYSYTRSGESEPGVRPETTEPAVPAAPDPYAPAVPDPYAPAASEPAAPSRPGACVRPATYTAIPAAPAASAAPTVPSAAAAAGTVMNAPGWSEFAAAATRGETPYETQSPGWARSEDGYGYRPAADQPDAVPGSDSRPALGRYAWWIPVVLLLTLAVGALGGFLGSTLLNRSRGNAAPAGTEAQSHQQTPISGQIQHGEKDPVQTAPGQVYQDNVNAVVGISNSGTTTNVWGQVTPTASSGTGFIISEDGYILTNYHVVKDANTLTVTLYDGRKFPAQLVGYEATTCDVALLKIDATGLHTVRIGDSDALQVGEQVCAIGNPLGELTYSLTVGYISAKERAINTDGNPISMLQTDAAINDGNSGGPLFDCSGNVVGIVTAKYSGSLNSGAAVEGLGFAIPINTVMNMLDDLMLYGRATNRAYLGIRAGDAAQVTGLELPDGAYVTSVDADHCAARAGLQPGDVVVGIDDRTVFSMSDLLAVVQSHTAGQTVQLRVWRDGTVLTLDLTFDARPEGE